MTRSNKIIVIAHALYILFMAFYGIFGLVQAAKAWANFVNLSFSYSNMMLNWQSKFITDILVV